MLQLPSSWRLAPVSTWCLYFRVSLPLSMPKPSPVTHPHRPAPESVRACVCVHPCTRVPTWDSCEAWSSWFGSRICWFQHAYLSQLLCSFPCWLQGSTVKHLRLPSTGQHFRQAPQRHPSTKFGPSPGILGQNFKTCFGGKCPLVNEFFLVLSHISVLWLRILKILSQ